MNIGFFTDVYHPGIDGIVTALDMFLIESAKNGDNTFIITPKYPNYIDSTKNIIRVPSVPFFFYPPYRFGLPGFSTKTYDKIKELKLDVIHTHSPFALGVYGVKLAKEWNLPLVYTYHTLYPKYVHYFFKGKVVTPRMAEKLAKRYTDKCDCIIAPSQQMKDELLSYGVTTRIEVVPTGVNKGDFEAHDNFSIYEKHNLSKSTKTLLYAGRLGEEKNLRLLLQAYQIVEKKFPNTHLFLAGDGVLKDKLKQLSSQLGIDSKTTFLNFLDRQTLSQYYKETDIFVFPSLTETQGLVLIEVMINKTAVVAMNEGGVLSIIEDNKNGLLSSNNVEEFAGCIMKLLNDEALLKRLSQQGYEDALKMSSAKSTLKHIEIYNELIEQKKKK